MLTQTVSPRDVATTSSGLAVIPLEGPLPPVTRFQRKMSSPRCGLAYVQVKRTSPVLVRVTDMLGVPGAETAGPRALWLPAAD